MPNNGRITLCPFYRDEKNLSISCEDVFRRFRWKSQKERWLDIYCDKYWERCPHAVSLNVMYEEIERTMGEAEQKVVQLEHQVKELKKELKKTASMLGRSEKREKEKESEIKTLRKKNRFLEQKYIDYAGKLRQYEARAKAKEKDMLEMIEMYEGRFAYLMCEFADGTFSDVDFEEWSKGKEYSIVLQNGKEKERVYKAIVREEKNNEQ